MSNLLRGKDEHGNIWCRVCGGMTHNPSQVCDFHGDKVSAHKIKINNVWVLAFHTKASPLDWWTVPLKEFEK